MLKRSRYSFLATARWMLAIWVAVVATTSIVPCGKAFALPQQGEYTVRYAVPGAIHAANEHALAGANTSSIPSDSPDCVEIPSSIPLKATATSAPTSIEFFAAASTYYSPILESASAARIFTRTPAALPRVFLKTSRLLI